VTEEKSAYAGIETGLHLIIKLLDNVPSSNKLTLETIDFLYVNSKFIRPLSFWGETKKHFLLDKSLNDVSNYLRRIITNDKEYDINYRYKSMKILFNLAVAKGSLRNLLDFVNLTQLFNDTEHILDLVNKFIINRIMNLICSKTNLSSSHCPIQLQKMPLFTVNCGDSH
jgi:hypothetical protein